MNFICYEIQYTLKSKHTFFKLYDTLHLIVTHNIVYYSPIIENI